jgi:hypothetical protein
MRLAPEERTGATWVSGHLREIEETNMSVIDECGPAAASAGRGCNSQDARTATGGQSMLTRWSYAAALIVGLSILFFSPRDRTSEDIVQLERLVPQIERAQALAPEAREAINQLIARISTLAASHDQSQQMRRKRAIDRATSAMMAKDDSTMGRTADRPHE